MVNNEELVPQNVWHYMCRAV